MISSCFTKVVISCVVASPFLCTVLHAQPQHPKDQDWPKLMQLYEGKVVDIQYDSTGKVWYADWQGRRLMDMHVPYDATKTKFLYVDSTGKALSNKRYQNASPFYGGLACVWEIETFYPGEPNKGAIGYGYESAIINTKEEEVLPMDKRRKYVLGKGLAVSGSYMDPNMIIVYNKTGKKLAECTDCNLGVGVGMDNFWMAPKYDSRPFHGVKLFDLTGKILYNEAGLSIQQIDNDLPSTGQFRSISKQPYYRVLKGDYQGLNTILDRHGKVVMDSVNMSSFNLGKSEITRNGLAAVVDTNWNIIVPFSYGYTTIRVPAGHPQGAYFATKNNKTIVINADNKKLIPLVSHGGISYNYKQGYYYEAYDANRNRLLISLNGDTLVEPTSYELEREQSYEIPGFFVTCKSNGLKGYLDKHGKVLIPCEYDNLFFIKEKLFLFFSHDGASGYIDLQGNRKFSLREVTRLSSMSRGYARCMLKVSDKKQFRPREEIFTEGSTSYQLQERVIDSTGQFVVYETFPSTIKQYNNTLRDGSQIISFFYKGAALVFNKKTNKYGLVNENLQVILPVIYDNIDTRAEHFEYYWYSVNGPGQNVGRHGVSPNVLDGRVKVTLKGVEKIIDVEKLK